MPKMYVSHIVKGVELKREYKNDSDIFQDPLTVYDLEIKPNGKARINAYGLSSGSSRFNKLTLVGQMGDKSWVNLTVFGNQIFIKLNSNELEVLR